MPSNSGLLCKKHCIYIRVFTADGLIQIGRDFPVHRSSNHNLVAMKWSIFLLNFSVVSLETNNCPEKKLQTYLIWLNPNHYRLPWIQIITCSCAWSLEIVLPDYISCTFSLSACCKEKCYIYILVNCERSYLPRCNTIME